MKQKQADKVQKTKHRIKISKKWLLINVGFAVVFVAVLFTGYYLATKKDTNTNSSKSKITKTESYKTIQDAQKLISQGNDDEAISLYESSLKTTEKNSDKISILLAQAAIYLNNGDYDNAIVIAKKAESIEQTFAVVDFLARVYEISGEDSKVIVQYYEKAKSLLNKNTTAYDDEIKAYEDKIAELNDEVIE